MWFGGEVFYRVISFNELVCFTLSSLAEGAAVRREEKESRCYYKEIK